MHMQSTYKPRMHRGQATGNEENGCDAHCLEFRVRAATEEETGTRTFVRKFCLGCVNCKRPIVSPKAFEVDGQEPAGRGACSLQDAQLNPNSFTKAKRGSSRTLAKQHLLPALINVCCGDATSP